MGEQLALKGGPKAIKEDRPEVFRWPGYGDEEFQAVKDAMESGDPYSVIKQFEAEFASYLDVKYTVAQNNGTSTLHSSYFAVGVSPGDEVITPSHSWLLQIVPIVASHGIPVFADVDPKTLTLDPDDVQRKITPRTRAIVVVHTYGHPAEMDPIMEVAGQNGIPVIEDCSHAHGAEHKGRKIGTIGDIGCFSLQHSKLLPATEGGILVTNNEQYHERVVLLGHYERLPSLENEWLKGLSRGIRGVVGLSGACFGYKYRMHPLAAAIARVRLRHLNETNYVRRRNMDYLSKGLSDLKSMEPPYSSPNVKMAWLIYLLRYYPERLGNISRTLLVKALQAEGVRVIEGGGYQPFHLTELMQIADFYGRGCPLQCSHVKSLPKYEPGTLPVTESISERLMSLAIFANSTTERFMDQYIEAFHKVEANADQLQ